MDLVKDVPPEKVIPAIPLESSIAVVPAIWSQVPILSPVHIAPYR